MLQIEFTVVVVSISAKTTGQQLNTPRAGRHLVNGDTHYCTYNKINSPLALLRGSGNSLRAPAGVLGDETKWYKVGGIKMATRGTPYSEESGFIYL